MEEAAEIRNLIDRAEERIRAIVMELDDELQQARGWRVIGLDLDTRRFANMRVDVLVG